MNNTQEELEGCSPSVKLGNAALELSRPGEPVRGLALWPRDRGTEASRPCPEFCVKGLFTPALELGVFQGHAEESQGQGKRRSCETDHIIKQAQIRTYGAVWVNMERASHWWEAGFLVNDAPMGYYQSRLPSSHPI